jgi:tetratricopeptide (TPR) repeat protein
MTGAVEEGDREAVERLALKRISRAAIPRALERAERYRLLNEPEQAESICLDILAVDPRNQQALVFMILSITDRFAKSNRPSLDVAREHIRRLTDPYQRHYYEGIAWEREGRARLQRSMGSSFAYDSFRNALDCYERASSLSPADDDEAILRWNACVRVIERARLRPRPAEAEQPLE